jgi:hypothetical protein
MARDDSRLRSKDFVNDFGAVEAATAAFQRPLNPSANLKSPLSLR